LAYCSVRASPRVCVHSLALTELQFCCTGMVICTTNYRSISDIGDGKSAQFELPQKFTKLTYNDSISD